MPPDELLEVVAPTPMEMVKSILADEDARAALLRELTPEPLPEVKAHHLKRALEHGRINVPFEVKTLNEDTGEFEGHAGAYSEDLGNDVIVPGAFKRTLNASKGKVPVLWFHDPMQPVGIGVEANEDTVGLAVKGQLDLNTQRGRETLSGMKMGYIDCMSIGYEVPKGGAERKDGIRYLKELGLVEYSLLTKGFAMNPDALLTGVKDFNSELAHAQAEQASYQTRYRLDDALNSVISELTCDDKDGEDILTPDEKVGMLRASLAQYTEALCAWLVGKLALEASEDTAEGDMPMMTMTRDLTELAMKVGRRNSGGDAATIKQAIDLLQALLDNKEAPAEDDSTVKSLVADGPQDGDREATAVDTARCDDLAARVRAGLVRLQS